MRSYSSPLAHPLPLPCGTVLPNRFVKSAMGEGLAGRDRLPNGLHCVLYRAWADGGAGALITGNIMVDPDQCPPSGNVAIGPATPVEPFRAWAASVRGNDCKILAQLNHPGRQIAKKYIATPLAPSPIRLHKGLMRCGIPRQLEHKEILGIIDAFSRAARVCQAAGFDGVEIHAEHGYLISQFLSPLTNHRTDEWGGDPVRRQQFLIRIAKAVRDTVGADFVVGVKLNSADFQRGGLDNDESLAVMHALAGLRIDFLEISGGTYESPVTLGKGYGASSASREAYFTDFAIMARKAFPLPILLTGGFRTASAMSAAVEEGVTDLVGLARALAQQPGLPRCALSGQQLPPISGPRLLGHKRLDALVDLRWHVAQIQRIAAGQKPDLALSSWSALKQSLIRIYGI